MSPDVIYDYSNLKAPKTLAKFQAIAMILSRLFLFNLWRLDLAKSTL